MTITVEDLLNEEVGFDGDVGSDSDKDAGNGLEPGAEAKNADDGIGLDEETSLRGMAEVLRVLDESATEEQLHEAMNIIRLNKQSKTTNLAHRTALVMARQANDPLYMKYAKFNGIRLSLRELIFKKYGAKAASRARQLLSGTAKPLVRK